MRLLLFATTNHHSSNVPYSSTTASEVCDRLGEPARNHNLALFLRESVILKSALREDDFYKRVYRGRTEIFTAMKIKAEIFWNAMPHHLHPEEGGGKVLRNVGIIPQQYTTSRPRSRLECNYRVPREDAATSPTHGRSMLPTHNIEGVSSKSRRVEKRDVCLHNVHTESTARHHK